MAEIGTSRRRWLILALGVASQTSACLYLYGLAVLVPTLRRPGVVTASGLSLSGAGAVVASCSLGLLMTLIAWGAAADRFGERRVIALGLALSALTLLAASRTDGFLPLVIALTLAGAAGGSVNAASGRMVLGWFSKRERGLAMGIRQTAQPLGVGVGALLLPPAAHRWGFHDALLVPALACAVLAVLVSWLAVDPPRPVRDPAAPAPSPYRGGVLWRIHAASACLVVPQFAVGAFTAAYLVSVLNWSLLDAGRFVFVLQIAGAAGRIAAGVWSDRVGSRLRPMRTLAVLSAALMVGIAVTDRQHWNLVVVMFALAAVVTVADNGLAFTAVAERAGPFWAGRALGVQNTGQNVAAVLTPPLLGAVFSAHGYALGFALAAILPLVAIVLTPVSSERAQDPSVPEALLKRA